MKLLKLFFAVLILNIGTAYDASSMVRVLGGVKKCTSFVGSYGNTYTIWCGNDANMECITMDGNDININCTCCTPSGIYQNSDYTTGALISRVKRSNDLGDLTMSAALDPSGVMVGTEISFFEKASPLSTFNVAPNPVEAKTVKFSFTSTFSGNVEFQITNPETSENYQMQISCVEGSNISNVVVPDKFSGACIITLFTADARISKTVKVN